MKQLSHALFVLAVCGGAMDARGSWESMVQVAQPLEVRSGETAVRICRVPYVGHSLNPRDRGKAVPLTVAPNRVWCDTRTENRNLAALAGIRFDVEIMPDPLTSAVVVAVKDTLHVTVEFGAPVESLNPALETVLQATLWCGLLNARQLWPDVRFVEYTVIHEAMGSYSGVYSLSSVESSAEVRWGRASIEALESCRGSAASGAE